MRPCSFPCQLLSPELYIPPSLGFYPSLLSFQSPSPWIFIPLSFPLNSSLPGFLSLSPCLYIPFSLDLHPSLPRFLSLSLQICIPLSLPLNPSFPSFKPPSPWIFLSLSLDFYPSFSAFKSLSPCIFTPLSPSLPLPPPFPASIPTTSMEGHSQRVLSVPSELPIPFPCRNSSPAALGSRTKHGFLLFSLGYPWLLALLGALALGEMLHQGFLRSENIPRKPQEVSQEEQDDVPGATSAVAQPLPHNPGLSPPHPHGNGHNQQGNAGKINQDGKTHRKSSSLKLTRAPSSSSSAFNARTFPSPPS